MCLFVIEETVQNVIFPYRNILFTQYVKEKTNDAVLANPMLTPPDIACREVPVVTQVRYHKRSENKSKIYLSGGCVCTLVAMAHVV